jgi:plastocyanin
MRMRLGIVLVALLFVSAYAAAANDRRVVDEKNKAFSVASLLLRPGERVTLTNNDDTTHHVFIPGKRDELSLKRQDPGESVSIQFNERGAYEVRCNFHAKMKLMVFVKDY